MWNRIARGAAQRAGIGLWETARLLAVLNLAQADASISVWEAKYFYSLWRPITAIRRADLDGNGDTQSDPGWTSLLTASNHPEYPSAHGYQAASAAEVLAETFGDAFEFESTSTTLPMSSGVTSASRMPLPNAATRGSSVASISASPSKPASSAVRRLAG